MGRLEEKLFLEKVVRVVPYTRRCGTQVKALPMQAHRPRGTDRNDVVVRSWMDDVDELLFNEFTEEAMRSFTALRHYYPDDDGGEPDWFHNMRILFEMYQGE